MITGEGEDGSVQDANNRKPGTNELNRFPPPFRKITLILFDNLMNLNLLNSLLEQDLVVASCCSIGFN